MVQTTIRIGNSVGVIIPKNVLKEKNIKLGDEVEVKIESVKKTAEGVHAIVDPEVYSIAKSLIKRYDKAFAELANK